MDIVFDIDGTLANAEHRLHFIKDMAFWKPGGVTRDLKPDWESFLCDEQISGDRAMEITFEVMDALLHRGGNRVLFITGRPERQRQTTISWFEDIRPLSASLVRTWTHPRPFPLYMRQDGDRRPSHVVKEELLNRAKMDGFDPKLVFEDRKDDTAMWRRNGLLCCQVAEGDY